MGDVDKHGGEFYLDANSSGSERAEWDNYVRDQYGHYDIMQYEDAPVVSYTVSDDAVGRDWLTFQEPTKTKTFESILTARSFTIRWLPRTKQRFL